MLAFTLYAYAFRATFSIFSPLEEDLTVEIGPDTTLCTAGARVDFRPEVSNPDVFQVLWRPGVAVDDSTELNTFGIFDTSTTLELTVSTITDEELIVNGDFSQGNTGFTTDYELGNSTSSIGILAPENTYAITTNPASVHRRFAACTNHAGTPQIMVVNGSGIPNNVWCQEVTVEPNTDYVFSAWLASMTNENPARLQFSINGVLLGDEMQAEPNTCLWRQFFATWRSGNGTVAEICIVNVNNDPAGNDFALDDISFRPLCIARDTIQVDVATLNPAWSGPAQFCSDEAPTALNSFLAPEATTGGEWTIDGTPADTLRPGALSPGEHQVSYTVRQAQCEETLESTVEILEVRSAGTAREPAQFCTPTDEVVNLFERLEGADPGGTWTETSAAPAAGNAFDAAQGTFDLSGLSPGVYTFRYTQTAPAGCNDSEAEVTIELNPSPVADAGPDMTFDCAIDMLTIGGTETSFGSEFNYQWTALNGSPIEAPNESLTEITRGDTYVLRVEHNQTGCFATDTVVVTSQQPPPELYARSIPISCPGANDGRIIVDSIAGGTEPFALFLNGNRIDVNQSIQDLVPGVYTLAVEDVNGCTDNMQFDLPDPLPPNLSIDQQSIGDSVALSLQTDLTPADIQSIDWSALNVSCLQCLSVSIPAPPETMTYSIELTDRNGCTYPVSITIEGRTVSPEEVSSLFIPNAFSPNEDGNNDYFTIFSAKGQAANIKMMQIVDRWGNLIFSKQNFPPDQPSAGWDGLYNGRRLDPGVFIFIAEVEMSNGQSVLVQGDIAVVY